LQSVYHAFTGLATALERERNLRIHCCVAFVVAIAAVVLQVEPIGCAVLALAAGMVITAELMNTALEHLVDLSSQGEFSRLARSAKDTAAGAVLCASLASVVIGVVIFLPRILNLIAMYRS
jgi:diacylglycerol kinase